MSRLETLIDALRGFYGALPPPPRDPFRLFVWVVLSVHSTPRKRDAAFGALKRIRALTPDAMWRAPQKKLEDSVALAGPYAEQRLRALRTGVDRFRRRPDLPDVIRGPLVGARRALKGLPQMGEGGAHRMLLFAADHPVLPVDLPIEPRGPASRLRRPESGRDPRSRKLRGRSARQWPASCHATPRRSGAHSCTCPTTAPPPARSVTRTAASVRCLVTALTGRRNCRLLISD